jgi:hypothetical protein
MALTGLVGTMDGAARAQSFAALRHLSIDELANIANIEISKRPLTLRPAAAAAYVIATDDIPRSGATSLPEALRLASNLEVARINSQDYTISARGFNSANAADKPLVPIDGRTIHSQCHLEAARGHARRRRPHRSERRRTPGRQDRRERHLPRLRARLRARSHQAPQRRASRRASGFGVDARVPRSVLVRLQASF